MEGDLLNSYIYKLSRAQEHLDTLGRELRTFLRPGSYEIINEYNIEEEHEGVTRGRLTRRVFFKEDPPLLKWGIIVGDCIHNLRSALDHIVFAISFSRDPNEFKNDNPTEFPIYDDHKVFSRRRRKNWAPHHEIRGLPSDAQAIIEELQPYHRGQEHLSFDSLWILREMSNIDKHRYIHITGWSAYTLELAITGLGPGVSIHSHWTRPPGVINSGGEIAEIVFSTPDPTEPAMTLQKEFFFTVSFGDGTPLVGQQVQGALYTLASHVESITKKLSPFIKM